MAEIRRYVLVDADDEEGDHEYDTYQEAVDAARKSGCAVSANIYEYTDRELVWTPDGSSSWPPGS